MAHSVPAARSAPWEDKHGRGPLAEFLSPGGIRGNAVSPGGNIMVELTKGARAKMESAAKPVHLLGLTGGEAVAPVALLLSPAQCRRQFDGFFQMPRFCINATCLSITSFL
jgi:hypothetical protein